MPKKILPFIFFVSPFFLAVDFYLNEVMGNLPVVGTGTQYEFEMNLPGEKIGCQARIYKAEIYL